jgi:hypothetical protein
LAAVPKRPSYEGGAWRAMAPADDVCVCVCVWGG